MMERYVFYFALRKQGMVSLVCRIDNKVRSWYVLTERKFAGMDLNVFCDEFLDPLQASLHFGLHLLDSNWIDVRSLSRISEANHQWKHLEQLEEQGNIGFMYEMDCKLYPVGTYILERGD